MGRRDVDGQNDTAPREKDELALWLTPMEGQAILVSVMDLLSESMFELGGLDMDDLSDDLLEGLGRHASALATYATAFGMALLRKQRQTERTEDTP